MAVFEQAYKPYTGALTPERARFLVIPRHAFRDIFKSKITTGYFVICFVFPLIQAIIIYLHHNANALSILELPVDEIVPIDATFFRYFVQTQTSFGLLLAVLVGPSLVASDLANNAIPLYLSRPFSRAEYVLGKLAVLAGLFSAITWIPGLVLVLLQAYLEGAGWLGSNLRIAAGVFVGSWAWILLVSLLALAISALVRWGIAARAALFAVFIIPSAVATVVNAIFTTEIASVINLGEVLWGIWIGLFGSDARTDLAPATAWVVFALYCGACLWVLSRRVRAYEVVR